MDELLRDEIVAVAKQPRASIEYTISLQGVSKSFVRRFHQGGYSTFKSLIVSLFRKSAQPEAIETVALKELTMRIPKGASVGVIGRNGSGKSTLLKLITGIYKPDTGSISRAGRVSALIELGAGFHPDFTGRENIFLGGMIQGLSRREIEQRFDEIIQFAELEDFIDQPVRTYSSGMFMRLGFSLAIHCDPEVLLIDEVLAVGDEGFISKCKGKISELRQKGVTLMLVTHDLAAVERWCDEVLWLEKGEVRDRGEPRRVIDAYRQFFEDREEHALECQHEESQDRVLHRDSGAQGVNAEATPGEASDEKARWGSREVEILGVRLLNGSGEERFVFHPDEGVEIVVPFAWRESLSGELVFGFGVHHGDGTLLFGTNTHIEQVKLNLCERSREVRCHIPRLSLLDGEYWLDIAAHREDGYPYDYWKKALKFSVRSSRAQVGKVFLETQWSVIEEGSDIESTQDRVSQSRAVS